MSPPSIGGPVTYRRRAILNRIHGALDAFYLLQKIDWEYDVRTTLEKILALALEELEFEGGKKIERALIIIERPAAGSGGVSPGGASAAGGNLEVEAGWRSDSPERSFSRTVVHETIRGGQAILCENAKDDPRFMSAESIKGLQTLSLISVPLAMGIDRIGALYIESEAPGSIFSSQDLEFLAEFAGAISPYLKAALVHQDHLREIRKLRREVDGRYGLDNLVGRSAAMRGVYELVRLAAGGDRTVLITGESGCGKELVARAIHHASRRNAKALVVVDCSGLSEHLLESELFGHKKGAFTGASADKVGAFQEADGGTLFLDEVSDAPRPLQQKLRRVLQEGEIRRVGDAQFLKVDVRVICATNRSLPEQVEKGEFIRDLFFRINKFPIHIPPLRQRREDISPLVHHFISLTAGGSGPGAGPGKGAGAGKGPPVEDIASEALEILVGLDWQANNIRELRNVVELACDLADGPRIEASTVRKVLRIQRGQGIEEEGPGPSVRSTGPAPLGLVRIEGERFRRLLRDSAGEEGGGDSEKAGPFYRIYQEFAARAIIEGLRASEWKLRPAARLLGISPMKLRGELKGFIEATLARFGGDLAQAAGELEIPLEILSKKASDLGLEGPATSAGGGAGNGH